MKFGISVGCVVTKPCDAMSESRVFHEAVEVVELADELGFDSAWSVEHSGSSFLEKYSHMSAPDMFFAYCAARTKQIRFGHGIYLMLPNINHPARVAERIATLDILSNGRVELGTGRSATWTELGGFLVEPDDTKEMWEESTRSVVKMWTSDEFSIKGRPLLDASPERAAETGAAAASAAVGGGAEPGDGGARGREGDRDAGGDAGRYPQVRGPDRGLPAGEPRGGAHRRDGEQPGAGAGGSSSATRTRTSPRRWWGRRTEQLAGPPQLVPDDDGLDLPESRLPRALLWARGAAFRPPLGADQVGEAGGDAG